MSELISVIVPIYNVELYLKRCIDSILCQTYENLEIILIDDGSTDESGKICDEYQTMDKRIKVIHTKNRGAANARNCGINLAKGEYIGFVDSDDYIDKDMYESLVSLMNEEIDITCCAREIKRSYLGSNRPVYRCALNKKKVFTKEDALKELLLYRYLSFSVCTKLFKRNVIGNIRFPKGKTCEDIPFTYMVLKRARKVAHVGKPLYINCQRNDSTSGCKFHSGKLAGIYFERKILNDVKKLYPSLIPEANYMYLNCLYNMIMHIKQGDLDKNNRRIIRKMRVELMWFYAKNLKNEHIISQYSIHILLNCL